VLVAAALAAVHFVPFAICPHVGQSNRRHGAHHYCTGAWPRYTATAHSPCPGGAEAKGDTVLDLEYKAADIG
jgi:hypothetical protein